LNLDIVSNFDIRISCLLLRCFRLCGFWRGLSLSGFEFLHSAGGVYDFLVSGEKRMTGAANFHMGGFRGRAGFYLVAAGAGDNRVGIILGVYFFFHNIIYNIKALILQIICKQTGVLMFIIYFAYRPNRS